jgi:hypothetical protein
MLRRVFITLISAVVIGAAAIGLMLFAGSGATTFRVVGSELQISGVLNGASPERFESLLDENRGITTIVLGDVAGTTDITATIALGYRVASLQLNTAVGEGANVQGDAVLLFLSGRIREIRPGGRLTLRDWGGSALPRTASDHEERRHYVEEILGDDAFYWFTVETIGDQGVHQISPAEIERYRLAAAG